MLDLYNVGGERWTELIALTREARQRGWWRTYGLDDKGFVPLEAEATSVRALTIASVPGLLQTSDYAHAMFSAALNQWSEERLQDDLQVRMIRQERLTSVDSPLELEAIVDESALWRSVGGAAVMRAQLAHLVEAAALATVTLRVLPTEVGAHPGMDGAFTLLSFGDLDEPDVAYVEHPMGAVHIEKAGEVARATLVFDHLRSKALSPADSVALVERVIAQH